MSGNTIGIKLRDESGVVVYIQDTHEFKLLPLLQQELPIKIYNQDEISIELNKEQKDITKELEDRFNFLEDQKLARPPHIGFIIITNKCNMNCSFCYAQKNSDGYEGKINIAWIEKLKNILPEESFSSCNFSGGEPLIEFELVKQLRPYFRNVTIYTNGSLINDEIAKWLIETNTRIYVNLDYEIEGFEGHDAKNVRKNLQLLIDKYLELKDLIEISIVIQPGHLNCIQDLRKQSQEFEVTTRHEFNFVDGGQATEEAFLREIEDIESGRITIDSSCFKRPLRNISTAVRCEMNVDSCDPSITLNYRGDILLCHEYASSYQEPYYSKNKVSTILDFTIEKYTKRVYELKKKGPCTKDVSCSSRWFCGGICWANIHINPYLCDINKSILPYAMYLAINYGNVDFTSHFDKDNIKSITMR